MKDPSSSSTITSHHNTKAIKCVIRASFDYRRANIKWISPIGIRILCVLIACRYFGNKTQSLYLPPLWNFANPRDSAVAHLPLCDLCVLLVCRSLGAGRCSQDIRLPRHGLENNRLFPRLAILNAAFQLVNRPINRRALLIKIIGYPLSFLLLRQNDTTIIQ